LNEGVKFDEVARTFSEDKARQGGLDMAEMYRDLVLTVMAGGSLGWKTKGSLDPKFEEVAFALEPSSTSSPKFAEVKTEFGYHIIMVSFRRFIYRYRRGLQRCFRWKDESRESCQ
jgi:NIMA-interacting peptidyl-prolyl cis-trans isomerase 4